MDGSPRDLGDDRARRPGLSAAGRAPLLCPQWFGGQRRLGIAHCSERKRLHLNPRPLESLNPSANPSACTAHGAVARILSEETDVLLGRVDGHATATVKHRSLEGWRLTVVQPLRAATTDPLLALDPLGCRNGDLVVITNDGQGARELVGDDTSPARWTVVGIVDSVSGVAL